MSNNHILKRIFIGEPGYEEELARQKKVGMHKPDARPRSVFMRTDEAGKRQMEDALADAEKNGTPTVRVIV